MIAEILAAAATLAAGPDPTPPVGECTILDVVIEKSDPTFMSDGDVIAMRLYQECAFRMPGVNAGQMVTVYSTQTVEVDAEVAELIVDAAEDLVKSDEGR